MDEETGSPSDGDVVEASAGLAFPATLEDAFFFQAGEDFAGVRDAQSCQVGGFGTGNALSLICPVGQLGFAAVWRCQVAGPMGKSSASGAGQPVRILLAGRDTLDWEEDASRPLLADASLMIAAYASASGRCTTGIAVAVSIQPVLVR
jgi:hypothetical protein